MIRWIVASLFLGVVYSKFDFKLNLDILENSIFGGYPNPEHNKDEKNKYNKVSVDKKYSKQPDQIIIEAGYPAETHTVITPDGYILHIHRIPHSRGEKYDEKRPVVFLQHGLLASSADWIIMGPEHGLAFILSDAGYDVWMGNYRGNSYSHHHTNDSISRRDYWRFSWDEMAKYDLPTMLTHMMDVTGESSFYYIGHSMGTLTFYTACNYHPWIGSAARLMVGYGPHTVVPHMTSPVFTRLARYVSDIEWLFDKLGIYEFAPSDSMIEWAAEEVCDRNMRDEALCRDILFLICGYNKNEMNNTALPYIMGHTPAGTSTWNMVHYAQSVNHGLWMGLDFGSDSANLKHWNSTEPPTYSYEKVITPVALYWGQNDWLVDPRDVEFLKNKLPNVVLYQRVNETEYTHLDFLWGEHNKKLVYGPTIELMKHY